MFASSFSKFFLLVFLSCFSLIDLAAQNLDTAYLGNLTWRELGPFRGGRSCAVSGVEGSPNLFYFGSTGGGVWRTTDAGNSWENISDGYFGGSIGAIAVSQRDPNVIYVGEGEQTLRGNVSSGFGLWKSSDAGASWRHIGLEATRHIGRIRIHPNDPNIVYVAAIGDIYQDSGARGIYKSEDGGESWRKVLFADASSGAVDLCFDPLNPRTLYASTWTVRRTPYSFSSGGEGSKLWKSSDGGESWEDLSDRPGLPQGLKGIIGITASPAKPGRLWALIENEPDGGLFRSENGGKTWQKINNQRSIRQRAWYYTRLYAHPTDADQLYVMNVRYHHSKDGGKSFTQHVAPHGDHHDLWIDPTEPERMIIADDGGAQISFDGGANWTSYYNQPTAQFYRVSVDNHFPFRIYGGQQDNSSIRIKHRSDGRYMEERDWEVTAGGEAGSHAIYPINEDIVFGGEYGGFMMRYDHATQERQATHVWPNNPLGHGVENMKYRFQWNYPLFFSQHYPDTLYTFSNHVHRSTDLGQSWETISPDLTTNDTSKQGPSGGPITKDNTAVEYYCTIFTAAESPLNGAILWTGSDDGLVHLTTDGGKNWQNVTPKNLPEFTQINSMEADPFNPGGLYLAATRYKWGDFKPYLFYTKDYGKSWRQINKGIAEHHFTRVIRADPDKQGLLFAGTEYGLYFSLNDGKSWQLLQNNLPQTPITDLAIKGKHLVAATQGRGFWILDDFGPLQQMHPDFNPERFLFEPKPSYLMQAGYAKPIKTAGQNHPNGAIINYYLQEVDTAKYHYQLRFLNENGDLVRSFSSRSNNTAQKWTPKAGAQRFLWDLRLEGYQVPKGMILWYVLRNGPYALPGKYQVELIVENDTLSQNFEVILDPRVKTDISGLKAQHRYMAEVVEVMDSINAVIKEIASVRSDLKLYQSRISDTTLKATLDKALATGRELEEQLYQTKNRSPQDPLNYPIRLNNKYGHLGALAAIGFNAPTEALWAVKAELEADIFAVFDQWEQSKEELRELNERLRKAQIDFIQQP